MSQRRRSHHFSFGLDLKSPTAAALLPPDPLDPTDLGSYREELVLSLSSARELAVTSIREAQRHYRHQYDMKAKVVEYQLGDWVFVRFPSEETGKKRKLSRPWYGPFRVIAQRDPDLTVSKVYFPEDPSLQVHKLRVCRSPDMLPAGFYWYGARCWSPGRTPSWLQRMLTMSSSGDHEDVSTSPEEDRETRAAEPGVAGARQAVAPHLPSDDTCSLGDLTSPDPSESSCPQGDVKGGVLPSKSQDGASESGDLHRPGQSEDVSPTPPTRYLLRDCSQRRPPPRLMYVSTMPSASPIQQFGTNWLEGGE